MKRDTESTPKSATRPTEGESVRTTIVGGRPPAPGRPAGDIPRGVEVLVKKAAVDPDFRQTLLTKRAAAAQEIGLELTMAETLMLNTIPEAQLTAAIAHTQVPDPERRAFLGKAAAAMLAALGAAACRLIEPKTKGIQPDDPTTTPTSAIETGIRPDDPTATPAGIRPTEPPPTPTPEPITRGIRPDLPTPTPPPPPITKGIQPDLPEPTPPKKR